MTEPSREDRGPGPGRVETTWAVLRRFSRLWGFLLFLVLLLVLFRRVVTPFVFALLIAYLLGPAVRRMEPRTTRGGAVVLLYLVIIGALALFFGLLAPGLAHALARMRDGLPEILARVNQEWIPAVSGWIEHAFGDLWSRDVQARAPATELVVAPLADGSYRVDLSGVNLAVQEAGDGRWLVTAPGAGGPEDVGEQIRHILASKGAQLTTAVAPMIQALIAGVAGFLTKLVVTFMLAAFLLVDLEGVNRFVRSLVPVEYRDDFDAIMTGMDRGLAGVIRGQLVICLVNGALTYVGLLLFGIKYSLLLAVFAAVMSLVPIFGTIISSIPIALVALVSSEQGVALGPALAMLAWIAGIHLLEANVLNPKIIGESAHMHPVVVIFALLSGEHVYGLAGALLAVPVASMVQTIFVYLRERVAARVAEESS